MCTCQVTSNKFILLLNFNKLLKCFYNLHNFFLMCCKCSIIWNRNWSVGPFGIILVYNYEQPWHLFYLIEKILINDGGYKVLKNEKPWWNIYFFKMEYLHYRASSLELIRTRRCIAPCYVHWCPISLFQC